VHLVFALPQALAFCSRASPAFRVRYQLRRNPTLPPPTVAPEASPAAAAGPADPTLPAAVGHAAILSTPARGTTVGVVDMQHDEDAIALALRNAADYWMGRRPARPVDRDENWKCRCPVIQLLPLVIQLLLLATELPKRPKHTSTLPPRSLLHFAAAAHMSDAALPPRRGG